MHALENKGEKYTFTSCCCQTLSLMCSSTQAAKGIEQWPAVIENIVKLQAVADVADMFVTAANINQQDLRGTTLSQSRVISSFIKSPAGIYLTYKENSTYNVVIEFLAVHFPLGLSMGRKKNKNPPEFRVCQGFLQGNELVRHCLENYH